MSAALSNQVMTIVVLPVGLELQVVLAERL
jgi:hypothetical protein